MDNLTQKIGIVAGVIATVIGSAQVAPLVPHDYQPLVSALGVVASTVAALYHPTPRAS